MIKAIISDFSRVVLFVADGNEGVSHKWLYEKISKKPNYSVFDYFKLNYELLAFFGSLKKDRGHDLHIFTTDTIPYDVQFEPQLKPIFTNIYSVKNVGLKKDNPGSFRKILEQIGVNPQEAVYTDDKIEHVEAAKQAGLHAFHYQGNEGLMEKIKAIIS